MRKAAIRFKTEPPALRDKPALTDSTVLYLDLFQILFSGTSVSVNDIVAFCRLRGISDLEKAVVIFKNLESLAINEQNKRLKSGIDHGGKIRR